MAEEKDVDGLLNLLDAEPRMGDISGVIDSVRSAVRSVLTKYPRVAAQVEEKRKQ